MNKRVPVYAGTGAETTREAIRHTRMAEREGVDGALRAVCVDLDSRVPERRVMLTPIADR